MPHLKTIYTLFFLLLTSVFFGQTNKIIDSLQIELQKKQADTLKMQVLSDLSYYYLYQSTDTSLIYGKKLVEFATQKNSDKFKAKAHRNMGNAFMYSNRYDSAYVHFNKAFQVLDTEGLDKSAIYSSIGALHKRKGEYEKALEVYFEGIAYNEETGDEYGKFIKLLNAANVYFELEEIDKSIDFQLQAIAISETTDNINITYAKGTILNNIGGNYTFKMDFNKALEYLEQSLAFNIKSENKKELARTYNNIGVVYENLNQLQKAITFLKKSLQLRNEIGDEDELIETHMELAKTYGKMNRSTEASFHYKIALQKAKSQKNLSLISETYLSLSETYGTQNNPSKELESYKYHIQFKDSVFKLNNMENINELETKYESEKKDKEIVEQQLQIRKTESELQKKKSQNTLFIGVTVFLLIASSLLWFVFQQRQKRKNQEIVTLKREHQIKTLESLMEGEEKERFRIAKELHDGVNGDLSAIKFKLSSLLEMNNNVIKEAIAMIDSSCQQVRAISHNLVPPSLENFNLLEATEEYCAEMNAIQKTEISFQHLGDSVSIPKKAEVNVFRIIQELMTNSSKHSGANEITVQISCRDKSLQVTVEDDGKGYDKNNQKGDGIGLKNIASRVEYLQATIDVVSNNQGTSTTIEIDTTKLNEH